MKETNSAVQIELAKKSFEKVLDSNRYQDIIKDNGHLELLLSMTEPEDGQTVIDIGTGNGYLAFPIAEKYPQTQVYGIDIAETIIRKNSEKAEAEGIKNAKFISFDGLTYPFEEMTADRIVTRFALHHFPEIERAAEQMMKLLKRGGRLLISDPGRHRNDRKAVIDKFMAVKGDGISGFIRSRNWIKFSAVSV